MVGVLLVLTSACLFAEEAKDIDNASELDDVRGTGYDDVWGACGLHQHAQLVQGVGSILQMHGINTPNNRVSYPYDFVPFSWGDHIVCTSILEAFICNGMLNII